MSKSWEEMAQEVIVDGRPGDIRSAAVGWQHLLDNLRNVKESLETNVRDLGQAWKGPAYEAFKAEIDEQAKLIGRLIEDASEGDGIVQSLNDAADRLAKAQADMPIPFAAVDDIARARDAKYILDFGLFKTRVSADFLSFPPFQWEAKLLDWLNDKTDEARVVYERINNEFQAKAATMPGDSGFVKPQVYNEEIPEIGGGPGTIPPGGIPGGGGMPKSGSLPGIGTPGDPMPKFDPQPSAPGEIPNAPSPGLPDFKDDRSGSGLAGATPGLGSGGLGGGGLGSGGLGGGGLGGAGGGAGGSGGPLPGGGSLGRGVTPGFMPAMMGGMGAGGGAAGRAGGGGGGRAAGGLGGAAGGGRFGGGSAAGGRIGGASGVGGGIVGGMGAMGGRAGLGSGGEEHSHDNWLREDEDVWGADGEAAPGVLR